MKLALARVSSQVLAYDESPEAAARARANAARNELGHLIVERANAFDRLRALEGAGEQFGKPTSDGRDHRVKGVAQGMLPDDRATV